MIEWERGELPDCFIWIRFNKTIRQFSIFNINYLQLEQKDRLVVFRIEFVS